MKSSRPYSPAEQAFLQQQGIGAEEVFDGRSMSSATWKAAAKASGAVVVVTSSPCQASGHTIRTRSGHCAQCDTSKIAYTRRHRAKAFVYIAVSKRGQLVKVGSTQDPDQREAMLRQHQYGGFTDWKIVFQRPCDNAGQQEMRIHANLARYHTGGIDGRGQDSRELFSCAPEIAIEAARAVVA